MAASSIRSDVLEFLSNRRVNNGETVEYSWFIFNVVIERGRMDLEALDFHATASFTRDFGEVERIHQEQMAVLGEQRVQPGWCTLRHSAIVSRSYTPGHARAFMSRPDGLEVNASGWYVGITDEPLDINDPSNLCRKSLYEISIHDRRLTAYWLLPAGYSVEFNGDTPRIGRP